jgi:hypothetical protein
MSNNLVAFQTAIDTIKDEITHAASQLDIDDRTSLFLVSADFASIDATSTNKPIWVKTTQKEMREFNTRARQVGLEEFCSDLFIEEATQFQNETQIPVIVRWGYQDSKNSQLFNGREYLTGFTGSIPRPFNWAPEEQKPSKPKASKPLEKDLESDLLKWLHDRGIQADNQISTSKHRMDLWIPGKCFLELKTGKVSGDDVCQAIDYCAEYKLPVVLVGNHIGEMASRGIEAFNKAVESDMVAFVQWSAVKTYLKGLLA